METYNLFDHKYKAHIIVCWQYLVSTSHSILSSRWILIGISIMELANILMLHLINFLGQQQMYINYQSFTEPDPWETNHQYHEEQTLEGYQQSLKVCNKWDESQNPPGQKIKQGGKLKNKIALSQNRHFNIKYKPSICSKFAENQKQQFNKLQTSKNKKYMDTPLIRMQSCYPKVGIHDPDHVNYGDHCLEPIQQQVNTQVIRRSRSEKLKNYKIRQMSKYDINKKFENSKQYVNVKNSLKRFHKIQGVVYSSKQQNSRQSPDTMYQDYGDFSFWKNKALFHEKPQKGKQEYKIKRVVQYQDKWSINLLKKTALTNKQIDQRNKSNYQYT